MIEEPILNFNTSVAREKPNSVHHNHACPFCEVDQLTGILEVQDSIILLENKYPVIQETYPLLIIETDECESDLSEYPEDHVQKLMRFGLSHWLEMEESGDYKSVIFYKNHGPLSGGTIRHPHMQIVGLKNVDYKETLKQEYFEGLPITNSGPVKFNISTEPMIGFTEFNVIMEDHMEDVTLFSRYIQNTVRFFLNHFHAKVTSYNLFFYHWKGSIMAKIVPRFPTSPLFVGFRLRQVANNIDAIITHFKDQFEMD